MPLVVTFAPRSAVPVTLKSDTFDTAPPTVALPAIVRLALPPSTVCVVFTVEPVSVRSPPESVTVPR